MAKRKHKKRRGRREATPDDLRILAGKQPKDILQRELTPERLREAWEAHQRFLADVRAALDESLAAISGDDPKAQEARDRIAERAEETILSAPMTRPLPDGSRKDIESWEELWDWYVADPDLAERELLAEEKANIERHHHFLDDSDDRLQALLKELEATPEDIAKKENAVEALKAIQDALAKGETPTPGELARQTGIDEAAILEALDEVLADDKVRVRIGEEGDAPEERRELTRAAEYDPQKDGLLWLPTATVKRFTKLAREQGLPDTLDPEMEGRMPSYGRHIVRRAQVARTEDGHHYVRADVLLMAMTSDGPSAEEIMDDMLREPGAMAISEKKHTDLQQEFIDDGLIERRDGKLQWAEGYSSELDRKNWINTIAANLNMTEPYMQRVSFPLLQFGTLADAVRRREEGSWGDTGKDMPVHAGSRSFEAVWGRLSRAAKEAEETNDFVARARVEQGATAEAALDAINEPDQAWGIQAHSVLHMMRKARVITVDIDVSEGLPDWDNLQEAWHYAQTAQLPFDTIYLDFTTPGGFCPMLQLESATGTNHTITLRGALVYSDGGMTVIPFAWLEPTVWKPERLIWQRQHSDFDPAGTVHFVGDGPPEPITHLRIPGPELSAPMVAVKNRALMKQELREAADSEVVKDPPTWGWTEIADDLRHDESLDSDELIRGHAAIAIAAAARALSVLNALDSAVNIDLTEERPPRHERRAAERALKKGKRAEIAMTVQIGRAHDDTEREPTENGDEHKRHFSHAHYRRGHYAHYPLGTRLADKLAEEAPNKLVDHPIKGLCRRIYRAPTIVGRYDEDGMERKPVAKSYVWKRR